MVLGVKKIYTFLIINNFSVDWYNGFETFLPLSEKCTIYWNNFDGIFVFNFSVTVISYLKKNSLRFCPGGGGGGSLDQNCVTMPVHCLSKLPLARILVAPKNWKRYPEVGFLSLSSLYKRWIIDRVSSWYHYRDANCDMYAMLWDCKGKYAYFTLKTHEFL